MGKYWIFDFDGTLVDSEKPIRKCYQKITMSIDPSKIKKAEQIIIGPTLKETTKLILGPENINQYEKFIEMFKKQYDEKFLFDTKPYVGVLKTLKELIQRGDKLAIATNKRKEPTLKLIDYYGWNNYFQWIGCTDEKNQNINSKNKLVMSFIDNNPLFSEAYFVGDTENDALTAKENKLKFIKVNFGYGKNQNWDNIDIYDSINNFNEIVTIN